MRFKNEINSGFAADLYSKARLFLEENKQHRYADRYLIAKGLFLALTFLASYVLILSNRLPGLAAFFCAMIAGTSALLLAMNVGHDAAHECFVRSRRANHALQRLSFMLLGVDSYLWRFRHVHSHHPFPNINGCDIDIDQNPFFRLSPNQPTRSHFRWQHIYAPLIYCLTVSHTIFVQDFMYLYQSQIANLRNIKHPPSAHLMFYASKLSFIALVFALPTYLTTYGLGPIVASYFAVSGLVSLLFVFLLVGTHFSDTASFPVILPDGTLPISQAVHALQSSQDWCTQSRIAGFLTGGANCHAAHHLFPRLSHRHYRALSPIIEHTAQKHGIPYSRTNFKGLVRSHLRFLQLMSLDFNHKPLAQTQNVRR